MRKPSLGISGDRVAPSIEELQLRGISRTVAEIHWLLLVLVLVFLVFGDYERDVEPAISAGSFFYAAFVMSFRYAFFFTQESRAKIAIETWAMIAFITWTLAFSGGLSSPLLSSYLLPIITSALTLGRVTTLLEVAAVAACQVWLGGTFAPGLFAPLRRRDRRPDGAGDPGRLHRDLVLLRHPVRPEPRGCSRRRTT